MLTPFLIFAIAVSHGEQMINRFRGEIFFGGLEEGTVEELRARAKYAVPALDAAKLSFRMARTAAAAPSARRAWPARTKPICARRSPTFAPARAPPRR